MRLYTLFASHVFTPLGVFWFFVVLLFKGCYPCLQYLSPSRKIQIVFYKTPTGLDNENQDTILIKRITAHELIPERDL